MMTSALPEVRHGLGARYHNSVSSKSHCQRLIVLFGREAYARIDPANRILQIQLKTTDLSRLWRITIEFVGFIPQSLVMRSIVLDWNWSIIVIAGAVSQMYVVNFARSLSQALEPTVTLKQANGTMAISWETFSDRWWFTNEFLFHWLADCKSVAIERACRRHGLVFPITALILFGRLSSAIWTFKGIG